MCSKHSSRTGLNWFTQNREFTRLELGSWPLTKPEGAHCADHLHSSPNYLRIMAYPGVILGLIGLVLFLLSLSSLADCLARRPPSGDGAPGLSEGLRDPAVYGMSQKGIPTTLCYAPDLTGGILESTRTFLLLAFGIAIVVIGMRLNRERTAAEMAGYRPPVPVGLTSDRLVAVEHMQVCYTQESGSPPVIALQGPVRGLIQPNLHFTDADPQRVELYYSKYAINRNIDIPYHAGFLMFSGASQLTVDPAVLAHFNHAVLAPGEAERPLHLFWLENTVQHQPYLNGGKGQLNSSLDCEITYSVWPNTGRPAAAGQWNAADWGDAPVRLLSYLVEFGAERRLALTLQFNPAYFPNLKWAQPEAKEYAPDEMLVVQKAMLWFDADGLVTPPQASGLVTRLEADNAEPPRFQVEWRELWFPIRKQAAMDVIMPPVQFNLKPDCREFSGKLIVRVPSLLSGLRDMRYFTPLGHPSGQKFNSDPPEFHGETILEIDFKLPLLTLPWSIIKTQKTVRVVKEGVPTPLRIKNLLDELNHGGPGTADPLLQNAPADQRYVRRVIESAPQLGEYSAEGGRWQWDISGRAFKATIPADFHIVIYGKGANPQNGQICAEITVQGQTLAKGDIWEETLRQVQDELKEIVERKL